MTVQYQDSPVSQAQKDLDCDLAIVGGGIVGVTLASALAESGLKITLVEAKPFEVAAVRTQAYAFSILSSRIYSGIGVWSQILPHIGKFRHIRLSDADFSQVVTFAKEDLDADYLGYVAQHNVVITALYEYLKNKPNVSWLCPAEVIDVSRKEKHSVITVKANQTTQTINAKLVIGADGSRSQIRDLARIKTRGWKYWQSCVAFTIKHTAPQNDIAFERFWATGPMGILPLPGNRCQIVWTNPHARAKDLQNLNKTEFLAELEQYTGGLLGDLELVSDRVVFPVQLMQCDRYVQTGLALIGDAAHCCHPVGGQGLNLGIRDAATLAQILTEAVKQGEDIGSLKVLKRYEKWRKQQNLAILGFTDFLDRFFSNNWLPIVAVRRLGLWLMAKIKPMKLIALYLMTGLLGKKPKIAS